MTFKKRMAADVRFAVWMVVTVFCWNILLTIECMVLHYRIEAVHSEVRLLRKSGISYFQEDPIARFEIKKLEERLENVEGAGDSVQDR